MIWLLWFSLAGLLVYELYAIISDAERDTISELVWQVSHRPIIPFVFGVVMGHFFW